MALVAVIVCALVTVERLRTSGGLVRYLGSVPPVVPVAVAAGARAVGVGVVAGVGGQRPDVLPVVRVAVVAAGGYAGALAAVGGGGRVEVRQTKVGFGVAGESYNFV